VAVDLAVTVRQIVAVLRARRPGSVPIAVDARQAPLVEGEPATVSLLLEHLIAHALELAEPAQTLRIALSRAGSSAVIELKHGRDYPEVVVHRLLLPCVPTQSASLQPCDSVPAHSVVRRPTMPETVRDPVASLRSAEVSRAVNDMLALDHDVARSVTPWAPLRAVEEVTHRHARLAKGGPVRPASFPPR